MSLKNNLEPEDDMRDEYDFSGGVRGKFYEDPIPQIRIESRNPYQSRYPARRVISREALDLTKLLRIKGYSVVVEPDDGSKLNYSTEKGLREFLTDPIHMVIVGIPIAVIVNIVSSWLYQRFKRVPNSEEVSIVLELDQEGSRIRYDHKGQPLSEKKFKAILRLIERKAERYEEAQKIPPPDLTRPVPIFLEHTHQLVGWGRSSVDKKGLRLNDIQVTHKKTLKRMNDGTLGGLSIAGLIHKSTCSVCNLPYVECNHIAGEVYDGKKCLNRIDGVYLAETSLVEKPIQPKARIEGIKAKPKKRKKDRGRTKSK
jgi:hypothetical protein